MPATTDAALKFIADEQFGKFFRLTISRTVPSDTRKAENVLSIFIDEIHLHCNDEKLRKLCQRI
jgi:hypothetical protein